MFRAALLDFDGTLVNSIDGSVCWLKDSWFKEILGVDVTYEQAHDLWSDAHKGHPADLFKQTLWKHLGSAMRSSARIKTYKLLKCAHTNALTTAELYEGTKPFLDSLRERDLGVAVVTQNKGSAVKKYFSEKIGFEPDTVLSGGRERKEQKFLRVKKRFGLDLEEMVFVTDTIGDVKQACSLGLPTIGVSYGLHDKELLDSMVGTNKYLGTCDSLRDVSNFMLLYSTPLVHNFLVRKN